jgi:membrane-associated phospholipid phosphatase
MKIETRNMIVVLVVISLSVPLFSSPPSNVVDDLWFETKYSYALDLGSDILDITNIALPLTFAFIAKGDDYLGLSLMYATTVAIGYGSRTVLKSVINRNRPYTYDPFFGTSYNSDDRSSFPSGHAMRAFSSASFIQTLFSLHYPNSKWKAPLSITAWSLALTTSLLRIASGSHFITDVVAGAAIGALIGFGVPYLSHTLKIFPKEDIHIAITPGAIAMNYSF